MRVLIEVDGHHVMVSADDVIRLAEQAALSATIDFASFNFARSALRIAEASAWTAMASAMVVADRITGAP